MTDFQFSALHPDMLLDAIEATGVQVNSGLLALNSYENRVYQFVTEQHGRMVVKFYRPGRWTQQQLLEEHAFAEELAEHEVPVVAPLRLNERTLHHYEGFYYALYPSVGGRQFETDNFEQLEWMGRFIGRLHQISASAEFVHRPSMSTEEYLVQSRLTLSQCPQLPESLHTAFFTVLDQVIERTTEQYTEQPYIRLHGDCHASNILWRDGPSFVDLDDCRMGPAIQDIWMMLSGDRQQQMIQLDCLAEAYEEFRAFPNNQLSLIEPLRAMRMVHYMAWLARRWEDAAFPRAFPWFDTPRYWEEQILALKEQLSALQEAPLTRF
ncbi:serine/threonine protein kinase [Aestuariibacter halophilus]|uniref:Stress response kinase A n=1 Tax=Fluctibacter halophilus TaxID=226011 RepID=A0ABS8G777_9ALTE|nr:serine/threonine protein kinase [Aestuariibacter halophilus]MCC2616405.1 serine/threonine protein kinase [Aestuariibacter halophilus]